MVTRVRLATPHGAASADAWGQMRRLMIRCPVTGHAADTGFDSTALPGISGGPHVLVDCLECGQDHEWTTNDIWLQ